MSELFTSILKDGISVSPYLICTACAFVCGILIACAAAFRNRMTKSFACALVLLPAIVTTVVLMVNGNIGTGVAVAGAFSLVRFRSVAGRAKDIVGIFLAMTAGLACGAGYVGVALLFTALLCAALLLLSLIPMASERETDLKITVPEALHYTDAFDDLFEAYTKSHRLVSVKTSNMGSLYKLHYKIELKRQDNSQAFLDELRCRNGNLEITLCEADEGEEL